jgi:hypothetical protein
VGTIEGSGRLREMTVWAREDSNLQPSSYAPLTLNVLLSFAQFEREVTSERNRDITGRSASQDLASPCRSGADEPRSRAPTKPLLFLMPTMDHSMIPSAPNEQ